MMGATIKGRTLVKFLGQSFKFSYHFSYYLCRKAVVSKQEV